MMSRAAMAWLAALMLFVHSTAQAAESAENTQTATTSEGEIENNSSWKGEAELGVLITTGNTDTETVNARVTVENERPDWQHQFHFDAVRAKDGDTTTAKRYVAFNRSRYLLSEVDFLFGNLRYEDDEFAGYDQRTTEVVGYGRKFYNSETFKLSAEIGAGARQTDFTTGDTSDEAIVRVGTDLFVAISKTSSFKETLFIESGEENTYTESVSELKLRINDALAMKLVVTIKDNSDPPADNKNTDTETAVTLVYDF